MAALLQHFQPEGALEELLVEELCMLLWRHRRLVQAECAEIASVIEFMAEDALELGLSGVRTTEAMAQLGGGMLRHHADPLVLERALALLDELRCGIEYRGFDTDEDGKILRKLYGSPSLDEASSGLVTKYAACAVKAGAFPDAEVKPAPNPEDMGQKVLESIDKEIMGVGELKKIAEEIDA